MVPGRLASIPVAEWQKWKPLKMDGTLMKGEKVKDDGAVIPSSVISEMSTMFA